MVPKETCTNPCINGASHLDIACAIGVLKGASHVSREVGQDCLGECLPADGFALGCAGKALTGLIEELEKAGREPFSARKAAPTVPNAPLASMQLERDADGESSTACSEEQICIFETVKLVLPGDKDTCQRAGPLCKTKSMTSACAASARGALGLCACGLLYGSNGRPRG